MNKCEKVKTVLRKIPKAVWILACILIVGIFLRAYNFHDWLDFKGDQARDAALVSDVIDAKSPWPLLGATMNGSASTTDGQFRIGPMYYYFQIISAKLFGNYPDKLAYPDLIFSILSIPLCFIFLKKYFNRNLSLLLTGLYAISFFSVRFAHFAWNSNSIPFFTLLFLLALHEFRIKKEQVSWVWVVMLGTALGVGFQLHAISMILFSAVCFYFLMLSIFEKTIVWKKWLVVLVVFVALNSGQIINEFENNFSNTKVFLRYFSGSNSANDQQVSLLSAIGRDFDCHIEANFYIASSLGKDSCSLYAQEIFAKDKSRDFIKNSKDYFFGFSLMIGALFSLFGYGLLFYEYRKEKKFKNDGSIFISTIVIYIAASFFVMVPVVKGDVEFRYFNIVFFVPLIFLGLFINYLDKYNSKLKIVLISLIIGSIIASNAFKFFSLSNDYHGKNGINSHQVVLGEIEPIAKYMLDNSLGSAGIYIGGDYDISAFVYTPLEYLIKRNGVSTTRFYGKITDSPHDTEKPVFYLSHKPSKIDNVDYEKIGQVYVYYLNR
ncbi:MAG: glycosyltransferase family 39 protein [Candidatus Moranbacteria bacterium]|nr:glycosyltransferase family 39 protein [Candidatus Moranbacteria bacterium]